MNIGTKIIMLATIASVTAIACKTKKPAAKTDSQVVAVPVHISNIELHNQPLDTIKKYVTGQKWKLVYSIGGITGKDKRTAENTYYTLTADGRMLTEKDGKKEEVPYEWVHARDKFTGDSVYAIGGIVQWQVEGIRKDTLKLADNFIDGYHYSLIRAAQ